jgi:hypothetical protein
MMGGMRPSEGDEIVDRQLGDIPADVDDVTDERVAWVSWVPDPLIPMTPGLPPPVEDRQLCAGADERIPRSDRHLVASDGAQLHLFKLYRAGRANH